jgi:hypothetical protein
MSYQTEIRACVAKIATDVLPEQVYVAIDTASQSVTIKWQTSKLLTDEQRVAIEAKVQALLPAAYRTFPLKIG